MDTLYTLYKSKKISKNDWLAGRQYVHLKKMVLRSKAIHDPLHKSSIEKAFQIKGVVHDAYQSGNLESFWKGLQHYASYEPIPFLKILDAITGFSYPHIDIQIAFIKKSLKKIRSVFKAVDIEELLEKIQKEDNLG
jgi:hypothetical protein